MHIQPSDRAILYNIAMIQQKAAEMLLSLEPSKRTSEELQAAVLQAQHAAKYVIPPIAWTSIGFPLEPSALLPSCRRVVARAYTDKAAPSARSQTIR